MLLNYKCDINFFKFFINKDNIENIINIFEKN